MIRTLIAEQSALMLTDAAPVLTLTRSDVAGALDGLAAGPVLAVDDPATRARLDQMPAQRTTACPRRIATQRHVPPS